jgi:hypothetical protein
MPAVMTAPFDPLGMLSVSPLQRRQCGGQPTLSSRPAQAGPGHKRALANGRIGQQRWADQPQWAWSSKPSMEHETNVRPRRNHRI